MEPTQASDLRNCDCCVTLNCSICGNLLHSNRKLFFTDGLTCQHLLFWSTEIMISVGSTSYYLDVFNLILLIYLKGSYRLDICERQQKQMTTDFTILSFIPQNAYAKKSIHADLVISPTPEKMSPTSHHVVLTAVVTNYELYYSLCLSSNVIFKCLSSETVSLFPVEYLR